MYAETRTWNPFVGCRHNCVYCKPSFQAQLKRRKHQCLECYNYIPHKHPERLEKIPSAKIIFVVGCGDICFSPIDYTKQIIDKIIEHNKRCSNKTYYFQSKNPKYFNQILDYLRMLPNTVLLTTLETNRDKNYEKYSGAPKPSIRYKDFLELDFPRKIVTIEPIMDFDLNIFSEWVLNIKPEYVWIGYNSRPKQVQLPEPSPEKTKQLADILKSNGIEVRGKELRGLSI
jgi:DNA repair photolyase